MQVYSSRHKMLTLGIYFLSSIDLTQFLLLCQGSFCVAVSTTLVRSSTATTLSKTIPSKQLVYNSRNYPFLCYLQRKYTKRPDSQLGRQQIFAGRSTVCSLCALSKQFTMSRYQITIAVDDLTTVVDGAAQTGSLAMKKRLGQFN